LSVFNITDKNEKAGWPHRETDRCCTVSLQELSYYAQDRTKRNQTIKEVSDSNRHSAQSQLW